MLSKHGSLISNLLPELAFHESASDFYSLIIKKKNKTETNEDNRTKDPLKNQNKPQYLKISE